MKIKLKKRNEDESKKKDKKLYADFVVQLALLNTLIGIIIGLVVYYYLPSLLSYPPHSYDNQFQIETVGIRYTDQFAILMSILTIFIFFAFRICYKKIAINPEDIKEDKEKTLKTVRNRCFNYPYLTIIFQTFLPTIVSCIVLMFFKTDIELLSRICILVLSICSLYASISFMVNKRFFEKKLMETSPLVKEQLSGIKLSISRKLTIQTFPVFIFTSIILLLASLSLLANEKGDLIYSSYRQQLRTIYSDEEIYTLEDAKTMLSAIQFNKPVDEMVIFSADTGEVYYSDNQVSKFLVNYALYYYDEMDGHCYDSYNLNSQVSLYKIQTTEGEYYVGVRFHVYTGTVLMAFIYITSAAVIFNCIYMHYVGRSFSNNLKNLSDGFKNVLKSDNIIYAKPLPITSNDDIGYLTLQFNKIQALTKQHINQLSDSQDKLIEKERLASLGQMIGGIAHNLKTPIMSISGAAEGLSDLIKEYDSSIENPDVNSKDHHDIAKDMNVWVEKIKSYTEYMSDIITATKEQSVVLSNDEDASFTIEELVKRIDILMKHELKSALINLRIKIDVEPTLSLNGNVSSLVQVINNMISNSIQAYKGKTDENIDFNISKDDRYVILTIKDYASGLPKKVTDKLFKEMITTKGKDGTGLGLFMSYSTIRGHFNGDIKFTTEEGVGTEFNIYIPL